MSWNITKLMATGSLAVLRLLLWMPSAIILSITGNPLGVVLTFFTTSFIGVLALLIVREFGTLTLQNFITVILELPLPTVAPKIFEMINLILRSLVVDILFYFSKTKEKIASIICGRTNSLLVILLTYFVYLIIGVPGAEKVPSMLLTPIGLVLSLTVIFIMGSIGGYFGYVVYKKIENTNIVRRIQSD